MAWLPERLIAAPLADGRLVPAGGAGWEARVDLSVFTAPVRLDETGRAIWQFFGDVSAGVSYPSGVGRLTGFALG